MDIWRVNHGQNCAVVVMLPEMTKDFWKNLKRPIIALAPMDGYTDSAFRRIVRSMNTDVVVFTEFTSAEGLRHGAQKIRGRFRFSDDEHPIIAQIFGNDIPAFVETGKWLEAQGFDGIDINMGCPASHVVKSEQGVALRTQPDRAFALVEAVANATAIPVSVKTRLGWENADGLTGFGKGLENAGARCIIIHGRTYVEPYNVPADFEPILELKRNVTIPVIGNGGITSLADGEQKLGDLDGFMIARASIGNPWVFSRNGPPTFVERIPVIREHVRLLIELKGPKVGMLDIRKHLSGYIRGISGASRYRMDLVRATSAEQIDAVLDRIAATIRDVNVPVYAKELTADT